MKEGKGPAVLCVQKLTGRVLDIMKINFMIKSKTVPPSYNKVPAATGPAAWWCSLNYNNSSW